MKIGDLVTDPEWGSGYMGIIIKVWGETMVQVLLTSGRRISTRKTDLEVLNGSRRIGEI